MVFAISTTTATATKTRAGNHNIKSIIVRGVHLYYVINGISRDLLAIMSQ
jgi:hypothetical protein